MRVIFLFFFSDCGKFLCFRYYGGLGLSCLAQSEPLIIKEPDETQAKPRRFVRVKPVNRISNGIENTAFQDTEQELEKCFVDMEVGKKDQVQSGVRRKSPNENVNSESSSVKGGTKKKVRPNINSKSPSKEYYQIWTAENPKVIEKVDDLEEAPPLPPRTLHRPLERSHAFPVPPVVSRQHKPKKAPLKPEDSFGFELIDVDEPVQTFLEVDDSLSEKLKQKSPKKTIGSDNYITTILPKNLTTSSPCKSIESKCSHSSISNCSSTSSEDATPGVTDASAAVKPHKPLSRQLSNASPKICLVENCSIVVDAKDSPHKTLQKKLSSDSSSSGETPKDEIMHNNLTGTPLHVPKKPELPEPTGTPVHRKNVEPTVPQRPHPRALARVAGIANQLPVCPPTPTHHAKKRNKESFRPPNLKSFDQSPEFEIVTSPEIKHADIRSIDTLDGWAHSRQENGFDDLISAITIDRDLAEIAGDMRKPVKPKYSLKFSGDKLRALGDIDTRPPDVRSQELSRSSFEIRIGECVTNPGTSCGEAEASGGSISIPLRHLASTRLPSIPERSPRIITLETEHEEPLPPCTYAL